MIFRLLAICYGLYTIYIISKPQNISYYLGITIIYDAFVQAYGWSSTVFAIGGITIYASDMPIIAMVVILIIGSINKNLSIRKNTIIPGMWLIFFGMIVFSSAYGLMKFGINIYYLSDIRVFLTASIPLLYFYVYPLQIGEKELRFFKLVIWILVGYCYLAWFLYLTTGLKLSSSNASGGFRVFGSTWTLMIAIYAVYVIYSDLSIKRKGRISAEGILLIIAVIVLQHNSVWAGMAVALLAVAFFSLIENPACFRKISSQLALQIIALAAAVVIVFMGLKDTPLVSTILSTSDKYSEMGTGTGTIGGRQVIWEYYISTLSGYEWLIGKPMGTGWVTVSNGVASTNPPHNVYVQSLMRVGLVGTIAWIIALVRTVIEALQKKRVLCAAIIVGTLVYLYAYMFSLEVSCLWGIILGTVWNLCDDSDDIVKEVAE